LISDYVPTSTQRRIDESLVILNDRLQLLETRIDPGMVNEEEFSEIFKSSYMTLIRTYKEEKINAAISLIVNALLVPGDPDKLPFSELDHFSRAVDSLSLGALHVLAHAYRIACRDRTPDLSTGSRSITFEQLHREMQDTEPSFLMALVGELNSWNLLHLLGTPSVRTPAYGNYPIELPPVGVRFVEKIMGMRT
jgi:hypothetical protein